MAAAVLLSEALISEQLLHRPERPILSTFTNAVMVELDRLLNEAPAQFLEEAARAAKILPGTQSGGLSLVGDDGNCAMRALDGRWSRHRDSAVLLDRILCPLALERKTLLLASRPQRCFTELEAVYPAIEEVLLAPFFNEGQPAGVVWSVFHNSQLQFDIHDGYMLQDLARMVAAARARLVQTGHWPR